MSTTATAEHRRASGWRTTAEERAWMIEQYQAGLTPREIAAQCKWSRNTVERTVYNAGIPLRGCELPIWTYYREHPEELLALYEECGREMTVLADRLGVTQAAAHTFFTRTGLPRRSMKEAGRARGARMQKGTGKRSHVRAEIARRVRTRCAFPDCSDTDLEIHHLNGDRSDSREENLVALCVGHHMIVEFFIAKAKVHTVYKAAADEAEEAAA